MTDSVKERESSVLRDLTALLQLAHSGELAAALAYRGHWRSVTDAGERGRIRQIEEEEWHHRRQLRQMIRELDVVPDRMREARAWIIGKTLGLLCHVAGWLLPMYGAGRLESRNVREYEVAARLAWASGQRGWVECLLLMAKIEWEHERYFRERVLTHRLGARLRLWTVPPPKEEIRRSFQADTGSRDTAAPDTLVDLPILQTTSTNVAR